MEQRWLRRSQSDCASPHGPSALTHLNLAGSAVDAEGATALGLAIRKTNALTIFDLSCNTLWGGGAVGIASTLCGGRSPLVQLELADTALGGEDAAAFAGALGSGGSPRRLGVKGNSIGPAGAAALADAISSGSSLSDLDLARNDVGDAGTGALAGVLRASNPLTRLSLRDNWRVPSR